MSEPVTPLPTGPPRVGYQLHAWAQEMDHPRQYAHHYDLVGSRRSRAVRGGAVEVTFREYGAMMLGRLVQEPPQ